MKILPVEVVVPCGQTDRKDKTWRS